jgi:hypothetical protein
MAWTEFFYTISGRVHLFMRPSDDISASYDRLN